MGRYKLENGISYRMDKDGEEMMANFTALIVRETSFLGGIGTEKTLTLSGERVNPEGGEPFPLAEITISDSEFAGMAWPLKYWGSGCVILPGNGIKDDFRTAIQLLSKPAKKSIYRQTGWVKLEDGTRAYLHRGGAITAKGNDPSVTVQLPPELRYDLATKELASDGVAASLDLLNVAPLDVTWPLLAGTFAPLYGACDFAIHVTGRTGSFKSELMSLFQSHYGSEMDARHLPGSWTSSDNALEAMAFLAANAVFTIDDFVPHGSSYQQRTYQGKAERIFRSQGNQSGRQRLSDVSAVQQTMYPRGIVFSTGEDTPEGHSVRGRMIIREVKPGDITAPLLSKAQANRPLYTAGVAWLCQQFADSPPNIDARTAELRDHFREIGHGRTPSNLGRLVAVAEDVIRRWQAAKFVTPKRAKELLAQAVEAITKAGNEQQAFLEATDPVDVFFATLRQIWASGSGHIRSVSGGVPKNAEQMGWVAETSMGDDVKTFKARGPCIGWASAKRDELYFEPNAGIQLVKKVAAAEIPLSKITLTKRIGEAGKLVRRDDTRGRLTCRVSCEDAVRQVLVFRLSDTLELGQEVVDEE